MFRRLICLLVLSSLLVVVVPVLLLFRSNVSAEARGPAPTTTLSQTTGSPGERIVVIGKGYPAKLKVHVYFQTRANGLLRIVTDAGGKFRVVLTLPKFYDAKAKYFVHADSSIYNATIPFSFIKVELKRPDGGGSVPFGTKIPVVGSGFAIGEAVELDWDYGLLGKVQAGVAVALNGGHFYTQLSLPSFPAHTQGKLLAVGQISGLISSFSLVETAAVSSAPERGVIGSNITVKGGGFGSAEKILVFLRSALVTTAKSDMKGRFSAAFAIPHSAKVGANSLQVVGQSSGVGASIPFAVLPTLAISPNQGQSGTMITLSGSHFTPSSWVSVAWYDPTGKVGEQRFLASFPTNAVGSVRGSIKAPAHLQKGSIYYVVMVDGDNGNSNQVRFTAR